MRKIFCLLVVCVITLLVSCADYDEGLDVVNFDVKLEFPSTYDGSYEGLRVELQDAVASTFVDSTDAEGVAHFSICLLYTSPSPRDRQKSRMPSSA